MGMKDAGLVMLYNRLPHDDRTGRRIVAMHRVGDPGARLAEVVAALSLATDLGMGQPMEHALRSCLLALRLGEELGLSEAELTDLYYVALLRRIGCTPTRLDDSSVTIWPPMPASSPSMSSSRSR